MQFCVAPYSIPYSTAAGVVYAKTYYPTNLMLPSGHVGVIDVATVNLVEVLSTAFSISKLLCGTPVQRLILRKFNVQA